MKGFLISLAAVFLLSFVLYGCTGEQGYSTTGSHSPIILAGDDVENADIGDETTDNSTETMETSE